LEVSINIEKKKKEDIADGKFSPSRPVAEEEDGATPALSGTFCSGLDVFAAHCYISTYNEMTKCRWSNQTECDAVVFDFLLITKALTDENRLRILMALREREMCVCQVTGFLDLSPSTTSKHLSILRQARLIESRKRGKWVYYTVGDLPGAPPMVREAVAWASRALESDPLILEDQRRIHEILAREVEFCPVEEEGGDNYHSREIHSLAADSDVDSAAGA
jgi:DNA-binding transcriptional ArsR family regulator